MTISYTFGTAGDNVSITSPNIFVGAKASGDKTETLIPIGGTNSITSDGDWYFAVKVNGFDLNHVPEIYCDREQFLHLGAGAVADIAAGATITLTPWGKTAAGIYAATTPVLTVKKPAA